MTRQTQKTKAKDHSMKMPAMTKTSMTKMPVMKMSPVIKTSVMTKTTVMKASPAIENDVTKTATPKTAKTHQASAATKIARRDRIVLEHLPLVKAIAVRVHENLPVHVDLDDLVH